MTDRIKQDLTGAFTTKQTTNIYSSGFTSALEIYYSDNFESDELEPLLEEYREAKKALNSIRSKILTKARKAIPLNLPTKFKVESVDVADSGKHVNYTCLCNGIDIPDIDRYRKPAKEVKELTPIEKLAKHPDIKTILNCGILTREEKRKLFGLPANKEKQNDR